MTHKRLAIICGSLLLVAGCGRPSSTKIDVPFTSQAPQGDWSEPWLNACEETSIYMVGSFYADDAIKREEAVRKIRTILKVKNQEIKVSKDESLTTIVRLISELGLPWSARIVADPSKEDLKQELATGHPIIVPVYAPTLRASGFQGDGPDYHVLVLIGYDDAKGVFIVNDPGSKNGQGLRFAYEAFMSAIHDLNAKDYKAGKKAVLFTKEDGWTDWLLHQLDGSGTSSAI